MDIGKGVVSFHDLRPDGILLLGCVALGLGEKCVEQGYVGFQSGDLLVLSLARTSELLQPSVCSSTSAFSRVIA